MKPTKLVKKKTPVTTKDTGVTGAFTEVYRILKELQESGMPGLNLCITSVFKYQFIFKYTTQ